MAKQILIAVFLLFYVLGANAQDQKLIDSLRKTIPTKADDDTMKALLMNTLAFEYSYYDLDSGLKIAEEALKLTSITDHKRAKASIYNTIGTIYHDEANYQKAVESYTMARTLAEKGSSKDLQAVIYSNMGNTYEAIGDFKNAKFYIKESYRIFKSVNSTKRYATCLLNLGVLYSENNELDSAMYYFREGLKCDLTKLGIEASLHSSISSIYIKKDSLLAAEKELLLALELVKPLNSDYYEASYCNQLGALYIMLKKFDEAEKLIKRSLDYAKSAKLLSIESDANYHLFELYQAKGDYKRALEYHVQYATLHDSINSAEKHKAASELEKKYQTEKKQAEIEKLNSQAIVQEAKNKQQSQQLLFAFIGGGLLLCALGFAIVGFNNKKKANKQLLELNNQVSHQRNELQDKNKSITDSIHYAQRIQNVLLTSQSYIKKSLPEFFILNKPKDIVSGDFYWAVSSGNKFFLQVADCTGHGVPGAFMSLLGISFLNEIVLERKLSEPDAVLNDLRSEIINVFTDKDSEGGMMNDGMDCVLCRFDLENNMLHYAAANNAIVVIRNKEVIQLSGDKMPVGHSPREEEPFSLNEFQLQKGDLLYMFTDGYPDQFGGTTGKKFKVKNVKQLLLTVSELPFESQRNELNNHFENWRGNLEQVDDVLMVGIKI